MTWSLGYAKPNLSYATNADGTITANGVGVTGVGGWLDVQSPPSVIARGGPAHVSVRLQLEFDSEGVAMLAAHGVRAGDREHAGIEAFAEAGGLAWAVNLPRAVHLEIARRASGRGNLLPRRRTSGTVSINAPAEDADTTRPIRRSAFVAAAAALGVDVATRRS